MTPSERSKVAPLWRMHRFPWSGDAPMQRIWPMVAAMFTATGCATPPPTGSATTAAQCFWASQVSGFSSAGPDRAIVRIGMRERWELTLSPGCPDIDWAMKIGIHARGGSRICSGRNAELLVPNASGSGMQRCLIRDIRKLPPQERDSGATPQQ